MSETLTRRGEWMPTSSGGSWWPLDPRPGDFRMEDLARNLALCNRFPTSAAVPYSVAQHSVLVSQRCRPVDALWGLLHDAHEGVTGVDMARPIKEMFPAWRAFEDRIQAAICEQYGLPDAMPMSVREADNRLLATEVEYVVDRRCDLHRWRCLRGVKRYDLVIEPWGWEQAERAFLARFAELTP